MILKEFETHSADTSAPVHYQLSHITPSQTLIRDRSDAVYP